MELLGLGRFYLLGLVHEHWDIKESDINNPFASTDSPHGVNMGIAVIVPADKIIDIINGPKLEALRKGLEEKVRQARAPKPD